jgi:hypothetical protein
MFGGLKKMLGIEGVKIDVILNEPIKIEEKKITGTLLLSTMMDSTVNSISLKLIEKYSRGRKDSKLIDEYVIGYTDLNQIIELDKNDVVELPFELPFALKESEMDKFQKSNFLLGGLVKLAKLGKGVKSEFRIEAEALVKGTKFNPLFRKEVVFK